MLSGTGWSNELPENHINPIAFDQIGAEAGKSYEGAGLSITATETGATLRCDFQKLAGRVSHEGLWLTSALEDSKPDSFRITAVKIGRDAGSSTALSPTGTVSVTPALATFSRPGLNEEYSVSVDGVRQDFLVLEKPTGTGGLELTLAVSGASIEPTSDGVQISLTDSQRKISYNRLHVTDATGRELSARFEVADAELLVQVNDVGAVYPVRIDPTFSDANWSSFIGANGPNDTVFTSVSDGLGNLYIGGKFTQIGGVNANGVAKWDGSNWSALGSGMDGLVHALLFSNGVLYAGGQFTTAGGNAAGCVAKWNGTNWSAMGSGMVGAVYSLVVWKGEICAGGLFSKADNISVRIPLVKWSGGTWSEVKDAYQNEYVSDDAFFTQVRAMLVSGEDLYVGGGFRLYSDGKSGSGIMKWSPSGWIGLGSGMRLDSLGGGGLFTLPLVRALVMVNGTYTSAASSQELAMYQPAMSPCGMAKLGLAWALGSQAAS